MTLKKDFRMANMVDNGLTILEKYEKIADEFAIGFAEWLLDEADVPYMKEKTNSILEIYKQEKGL
jgi:hypothetical protein